MSRVNGEKCRENSSCRNWVCWVVLTSYLGLRFFVAGISSAQTDLFLSDWQEKQAIPAGKALKLTEGSVEKALE